jgi:glycerol-3-phosphate dehydrogenase
LSRDFDCIDHQVTDGVSGLISVTGGKATVLRAMAEKTVDLVCRKTGVSAACTSAEEPLLSHRDYFTAPVGAAG